VEFGGLFFMGWFWCVLGLFRFFLKVSVVIKEIKRNDKNWKMEVDRLDINVKSIFEGTPSLSTLKKSQLE
jgi:hypothetical protein